MELPTTSAPPADATNQVIVGLRFQCGSPKFSCANFCLSSRPLGQRAMFSLPEKMTGCKESVSSLIRCSCACDESPTKICFQQSLANSHAIRRMAALLSSYFERHRMQFGGTLGGLSHCQSFFRLAFPAMSCSIVRIAHSVNYSSRFCPNLNGQAKPGIVCSGQFVISESKIAPVPHARFLRLF